MKKNKDAKLQIEDMPQAALGANISEAPGESGPEPMPPVQERMPEPPDPELEEIENVIASNAMTSGWCELQRKGPSESDFAHCAKIPVSQFSIDRIREDYGGGEYAVRFRTSTGQFVKRCTFRIDARAVGRLDRRSQGLPPESADNSALQTAINALTNNKPPGGNGSLETVVAVMKDSADKQASMMSSMMTAQAAMIKAVFESAGNKKDDSLLPLVIELIRERGKGDNMNSLAEVVDTFAKLKDLAAGRSIASAPPKDEPTMLERVAAVAGPIIAPALAALIARQNPLPPAPGAHPHQPPPAAEPAALANVQDAPAVPADPLPAIAPYRGMILNAAEGNKSVEIWADMISDNLNDIQLAQLTEVLNRPDWLQVVFAGDSRAVLCQGWLNQLRDALLNPPQAEPGADGANSAAIDVT